MVSLDWKLGLALGAGVCGTVAFFKMDGTQISEVLIHAVDACKTIFTFKVEA